MIAKINLKQTSHLWWIEKYFHINNFPNNVLKKVWSRINKNKVLSNEKKSMFFIALFYLNVIDTQIVIW